MSDPYVRFDVIARYSIADKGMSDTELQGIVRMVKAHACLPPSGCNVSLSGEVFFVDENGEATQVSKSAVDGATEIVESLREFDKRGGAQPS